MLISNAVSGYRHLDFGNIKLAFSQVCREQIFREVYFSANSLYYVESGKATLYYENKTIHLSKGEIAIIKQHTKLDIRKIKDDDGKDFKSVIFYLFPDFVRDFLKHRRHKDTNLPSYYDSIIFLGKHKNFMAFCESLLPLLDKQISTNAVIREKTFEALGILARQNSNLLQFLASNAHPVKIDIYEFMIHNTISAYSVNELAQLTGRSISAFKRDFSTVFSSTPHQWLLKHKVDYAEELLRKKEFKSSEIYHLLGFQELSHFSAAFKKIKGISPTQI